MQSELAFFTEVEGAIARSSGARRADMARSLTDLFLANADRFSEDEITLIDDVFVRLVVTIEESSRTLLSALMAPLCKGPPRLLHALACDNAINVASPILTGCEGLDEETLIECAETKSQDHLLAISHRKSLSPAVTDILVDRGDERVALSTVQNIGATFSEHGFAALVDRSSVDERLAVSVGSRPDIPTPLFEQLLDSASEVVLAKLQMETPHLKQAIDRIVAHVGARIESEATALSPQYAAAKVLVESLNQTGKLNTAKLEAFASADRFEDSVAALALMSRLPIEIVERELNDDFVSFMLILTKAIGLPWMTTRILLLMLGVRHHRCAADDVDNGLSEFQELDRQSALELLSVFREHKAS
jgi:uncharacterized protein (DUF2336 family)